MSAWMNSRRWTIIVPLLLVSLLFVQGCGRRHRTGRTAQANAMDIREIAYDSIGRGLEIEFAGGAVYRYENVHPKTFEFFKKASAPREFFQNTIQGRASFQDFENVPIMDVTSEAFEAIAYQPASQLLIVRFNANSVFEYLDVPYETVEALVQADSVAQFFSRNIRGKYVSNRL